MAEDKVNSELSRIAAERLALALRKFRRRWDAGKLTIDDLADHVYDIFRDRTLRDAYLTAIDRSRTYMVTVKAPLSGSKPDGKASAYKLVQEPMDILKLPDFKSNLLKDMYADVQARFENHPDLLSSLRFMLAGKDEPEKREDSATRVRMRGLFGGEKE